MVVYDASVWKLNHFEKSNRPTKKLVAILKNGDKIKKIHFGSKGSNTYQNKTGIETGDPTHHDPILRMNYRKRHSGEGEKKWSAGYFSWWYLW
jgi:hypothetical protein